MTVEIAKKLASELVEEKKFKEDAEYFRAVVHAVHLTMDDKFVHPNHGDVFIEGDNLYGLAKVLKAARRGKDWEFELLIHKLKKTPYSKPKQFKRKASED